MSSDSSALLAALPSLLRLFLTSAFFCLLLSDVRKLLAGLAADVASVAAEVQIAAEEVEKAVDVDDEWFSVFEDKVTGAAQTIGELDPVAEAQETAKDMFIARVEEVQNMRLSTVLYFGLETFLAHCSSSPRSTNPASTSDHSLCHKEICVAALWCSPRNLHC